MVKKRKIDVSERDHASALRHNPFAALGGVTASEGASAVGGGPVEGAAQSDAAEKPRGRLLLRREKKGRGGKTVVVVSGFDTRRDLGASDIAELTRYLKNQLGCGGAVEAGSRGAEHEVVLQGDQPARVAELLRARGFRVGGVTS